MIVMMPLDAVAVTLVGVLGGPTGVILAEATLAGDDPAAFVAFTVNVYFVPFVRPFTVHERVLVVVHVLVPGEEVTV